MADKREFREDDAGSRFSYAVDLTERELFPMQEAADFKDDIRDLFSDRSSAQYPPGSAAREGSIRDIVRWKFETMGVSESGAMEDFFTPDHQGRNLMDALESRAGEWVREPHEPGSFEEFLAQAALARVKESSREIELLVAQFGSAAADNYRTFSSRTYEDDPGGYATYREVRDRNVELLIGAVGDELCAADKLANLGDASFGPVALALDSQAALSDFVASTEDPAAVKYVVGLYCDFRIGQSKEYKISA